MTGRRKFEQNKKPGAMAKGASLEVAGLMLKGKVSASALRTRRWRENTPKREKQPWKPGDPKP